MDNVTSKQKSITPKAFLQAIKGKEGLPGIFTTPGLERKKAELEEKQHIEAIEGIIRNAVSYIKNVKTGNDETVEVLQKAILEALVEADKHPNLASRFIATNAMALSEIDSRLVVRTT